MKSDGDSLRNSPEFARPQSLVIHMLMTIPTIAASGSRSPLPLTFLHGHLAASCFLLLLVPAHPVFASFSENSAGAAAPAAATALSPDSFAFQLGRLAPSPSETESGRFRSDFKVKFPEESPANQGVTAPSYLLQRGEYRGSGFGVLAEMGDIRVSETRNTAKEIAGRGGRFTFQSGHSGNAAKLETFATAGPDGGGPERFLAGATGEISLLQESARFKTIFLSGRESLDKEGRWPDAGARKGQVIGFLAVIDPYRGKLSAEAELDYSAFDRDTADDASADRDSAFRFKLGGGTQLSRYSAIYEKTGPRYRLLTGEGPARDSEGVALGMETAFELHAFEVKLSRYNDNTEKSELYPRLYRYEGVVDYRFKGFDHIPLSLQYRKSFIDSTREPLGTLSKEVDEDAVSARANYLLGQWDLGLRGGLSQRTDRLKNQRESSMTTVTFLPKFAADPVTVAPDFSVKSVKENATNLRTNLYTVNLGVKGSMLEKRLDYEMKGGYRKESNGLPGGDKEVVVAKVKAAYPLPRLFRWSRKQPSLGIRGEYKGSDSRGEERRENDFSLLITLDGGTFL
ncbi:MAG TPA: hypothetical protein DCZ75_17645 [Geobacter sp.]|nr:hypothetical protein [Geobacter sp.]